MRKLNIAPQADVTELFRHTAAITSHAHTHFKAGDPNTPAITDMSFIVDGKVGSPFSVEVPGHILLRPGDEVEIVVRRRRVELEEINQPSRKICLVSRQPSLRRQQRLAGNLIPEAAPPRTRKDALNEIRENSVLRVRVRHTAMVQTIIARVVTIIPSPAQGHGACRVFTQKGDEVVVGVEDIIDVLDLGSFAPEGSHIQFHYGHERKQGVVMGFNDTEGKFVVGSGRRADYSIELRQICLVQTSEEHNASRSQRSESVEGLVLVVAGYVPVNERGTPQDNIKLITGRLNPMSERLQDFEIIDATIGRSMNGRPHMTTRHEVCPQTIVAQLRERTSGSSFQLRIGDQWTRYQTVRKLNRSELQYYSGHPVMAGRPDPDGNRNPEFTVHFREDHTL